MLERLTRYLDFPEFLGPTINALHGILSGFIFFVIFSYYSLVIISIRSYLLDGLSEDLGLM